MTTLRKVMLIELCVSLLGATRPLFTTVPKLIRASSNYNEIRRESEIFQKKICALFLSIYLSGVLLRCQGYHRIIKVLWIEKIPTDVCYLRFGHLHHHCIIVGHYDLHAQIRWWICPRCRDRYRHHIITIITYAWHKSSKEDLLSIYLPTRTRIDELHTPCLV